ncbi:MAG: carboxypeptidase regulatory-like domain-containing protein, partial [Planctomycetes bacterium]|nr:carboxypeptidase regulatory-like domain-containing protein [Planctomycetota bacterium]
MAAVNGQKLMLAACGVAIAAVVLWLALTSGDAIGRGGAPDVAVPVDPVAADRAPRDLPSDVGERVAVTSDAGEPDRAPIVVGRVLDAWGDPATALVGDAASAEPVRTGERGEFELPLGRRGTVHLLALANGHAPLPVACEVAVDARAVDLGELQLLAGGAIRGNVVDAGGDGVEGATVTPTLLAAERLPAGFDAGLLVMPRMTGVAGAFVIPHLLPGTYRLAVTAPGRQRAESASITVRDAADTELPPIVLAAGHDLVGRVLTAEDVPIADAEVRVRCRTPRVRGQVASGTDGGFSFAGMPPGPLLDVEVRRPGFLRSELHGVDASRDGELVIRLEPGLAIAGVAVAARDGRPVERFAVACRRVGDLAPMSNGTVEQQLARRAEALRTEALASAEAERSDELLRLARELETRRATVPGDRLDLPGATAMDAGAAESRPGGRFRIEGLEEGLYDVGVAADGFAFARIGGVRVERGAPAPELRFDLDEGLAVVGQVRAAREHTPLAGATVELVA